MLSSPTAPSSSRGDVDDRPREQIERFYAEAMPPPEGLVYHIATNDEWQAQPYLSDYVPAGYGREGFIHFSYHEQVCASAERYYLGRTDVLVLMVRRAAIADHLVDENLVGGEILFPHLYAPLARRAVIGIGYIVWDADERARLQFIPPRIQHGHSRR